jgi:hypothetical protein
MAAHEPLNLKLDKEKDADIIEFLQDKPKSYLVKLAIRRFMNDSRDVLNEVPKEAPKSSEAGSDLLSF